jgi:hypothetical protein
MSNKASFALPQSAVITIVGGGFQGGILALQHLRHYVSLFKSSIGVPPVTLRLIERSGSFGTGVPVGTLDAAFMTDVVLAEKLTEELHEAIAAGVPVTFEKLADEISDITPHAGGITLAGKNNAALETHALVLATGTQSVGIVATGDTLPEALSALGRIGYTGKIYAISRNVVLPWSFNPALNNKELPRYRPLYLDAARVKKAKDQSAAAMEWRFRLEVRRAHELGYGVGHVLAAVDFAALEKAGPNGIPPAGLQALHDILEASDSDTMEGNAASPQRNALLQRYISSGRFVPLKSEALVSESAA